MRSALTGTGVCDRSPPDCATGTCALASVGPRDEDIAFLAAGLRQVTDLYREAAEVLAALVALADADDLPPSLRPVVERARDLAGPRRARCGLPRP
ncbi:hypothetical protein KGA66_24650 [Actinocrinis puniceicyclus]|uniref:Uncharacterized protein n=1 Tax=Actinocrinis puniceicyclus TaxID=977794 RepID=A0A8J7WRM4_9ACTN|nr:hypothetical protein [Actinocrinis puniceicyclus]MBS2966258.1 hypothetical protein [Actinocrinis puniceicyclus]